LWLSSLELGQGQALFLRKNFSTKWLFQHALKPAATPSLLYIEGHFFLKPSSQISLSDISKVESNLFDLHRLGRFHSYRFGDETKEQTSVMLSQVAG